MPSVSLIGSASLTDESLWAELDSTPEPEFKPELAVVGVEVDLAGLVLDPAGIELDPAGTELAFAGTELAFAGTELAFAGFVSGGSAWFEAYPD